MSKNHGGARDGAGRKPLDPGRKASTRGITLPARDWKKIDEHRGTLSPSHFIRSLISKLRKKR